MIKCFINGQRVYPSLENGLKMVIENPAMREKSSYTYEMAFPLEIYGNLQFFSPLNRKSVTVRNREYTECRLEADNKLLFSGKGIVTMVNEKEVRLQIVQDAVSAIPEVASSLYLDAIDYGSVDQTKLFNPVYDESMREYYYELYDYAEGSLSSYVKREVEVPAGFVITSWCDITDMVASQGVVGVPGKYVCPIILKAGEEGAASSEYVNNILVSEHSRGRRYIRNIAPCPNLMYVLRKVLEAMGYEADVSALNVQPWSLLYIGSVVESFDLRNALPHWTAATFLEEMQKLFNVTFIFDGGRATVKKNWENAVSEAQQLETVDEFEKNYDEEGAEYADTSNLAYELSDYHGKTDTIEQDVLKKFGIRYYSSLLNLERLVPLMPDNSRLTHFFASPDEPYLYYARQERGANELVKCGVFRPMFRDLTADNTVNLRIVPAPIVSLEGARPVGAFIEAKEHFPSTTGVGYTWAYDLGTALFKCPCVMLQEKSAAYATIENVLENDESMEKEDKSVMEIFFAGEKSLETNYNVSFLSKLHHLQAYGVRDAAGLEVYVEDLSLPTGLSDSFVNIPDMRRSSLSLNTSAKFHTIGDFHVTQTIINGASGINRQEELIAKFVSSTIPPVNRIFIIDGKRYIVKNFEVQVKDDGINKLITGHFYELNDSQRNPS